MDIKQIIFFAVSFSAIASAAVVAFSRNIIHSAFALLGVFACVAGLYIMLAADFVAIVQIVVYIGGILILILFAIMFTTKVDAATGRRLLLNKKIAVAPAFLVVAALGVLIWRTAISPASWKTGTEKFVPTTNAIGQKLLLEYLLPFEIISILLLLVLVGAVAAGRREVK